MADSQPQSTQPSEQSSPFLPDPTWTAEIPLKAQMTEKDAKFVFDQAEKFLKDSIDTGASIITRNNTIITILSALLIAISGYVISSYKDHEGKEHIFYTAILGLLYLLSLAVAVVRSIAPAPYHPVGALPINLISPEFFVDAIPKEERIIRYYLSESEIYQFKIEENNELNRARWRNYTINLWFLIFTPAAFFVIFSVVGLIDFCIDRLSK